MSCQGHKEDKFQENEITLWILVAFNPKYRTSYVHDDDKSRRWEFMTIRCESSWGERIPVKYYTLCYQSAFSQPSEI